MHLNNLTQFFKMILISKYLWSEKYIQDVHIYFANPADKCIFHDITQYWAIKSENCNIFPVLLEEKIPVSCKKNYQACFMLSFFYHVFSLLFGSLSPAEGSKVEQSAVLCKRQKYCSRKIVEHENP